MPHCPRPGVQLALGLTLAAFAGAVVRTDGSADSRPAVVPGAALPVVKIHTYTMAGRIRPLLFWIGRDRVGVARILWRRGADGARGYELLIGTDPESAPRHLNRWGYIAEAGDGVRGSVLALMSRSEESSIEEVGDRPKGSAEFKAMRAQVEAGVSSSVVPTVVVQNEPTFRDVEALIEQVRLAAERANVRTVSVPTGTRPGFLGAVAELVHSSVETLQDSAASAGGRPLSPVPYVYGTRLYDLSLRSHERCRTSRGGTGPADGLARGRFEIRNRATGEVTRFELLYGLGGTLAEVPVEIVYQPRWWLKVELRLNP